MQIFDLFYKEHHKKMPVDALIKRMCEQNNSAQEILSALASTQFASANEAYLIAFKYAIENGLQDLFTELLEIEIVKQNVTMMENTPLRGAASNGNEVMFKRLMGFKEVAEKANALRNSALEHAATNGHVGIVAELLKQPCVIETLNGTDVEFEVDENNQNEQIPEPPSPQEIHIVGAFVNGHHQVVALLLPFAGQRQALEEFLNEHMVPYPGTPQTSRKDFDEYFVRCQKHPIPMFGYDVYKKACSMVKQPARDLSVHENGILTHKREAGVITDESEVAQIRKTLNIPGTELNADMSSLHNAIKISL